jgi:RNA polymerase sigma-70 factor, ECF subfamily
VLIGPDLLAAYLDRPCAAFQSGAHPRDRARAWRWPRRGSLRRFGSAAEHSRIQATSDALRFNAGGASRVLPGVMVFPRLVSSKSSVNPLQERTDDELMMLAQTGARQAFGVLVERHARRVVQLCARFVNDAQLGQELAQDTWVMAWQRRETYVASGGFVPWIITVARNHCRNELRRRHVVAAHHQAERLELQGTPEQIDALLVAERSRRVREAMTELSPAMREALLLRYAEELRYDEMTTVVGATESTLRSRVHHGLKMLKQKLEKES